MASKGQIISRRQFLRGDFSSRRRTQRPPWAMAEAQFLSRCDGCDDCREACMQRIIVLTDGGYPRIDFLNGECTFCGDCARACTEGALAYSPRVAPWRVKAVVMPECLARRGVVCRSCGEQCAIGAIRFHFVKGGIAQPQVDPAACTGCGVCFAVCPAQAIALRDDPVYQEACA